MSLLALDQGTSSTKAILVDEGGEVVAAAHVPVRRGYPRPGWVEQDPTELWESALAAVDAVLADASFVPAALAITNQRESVVVWDRATGRPLGPCVTWQCRRGAEHCDEIRSLGAEATVRDLTGLPLDPSFSAPKLRWLLDADPRVRAAAENGDACAGTVDSWLVWNLTVGAAHVTDVGNASRTLLFDIDRLAWSDELLELFDIPPACLPTPEPSSGVVGEAVAAGRLPAVPIAALVADSHAALYGHGCLRPSTAKATFGTGTSLMTPTGASVPVSRHGLASTVAWGRAQPTYALEGNILSSGATVQWVAELLGLDTAAVESLSASVPDAGGVHLVPGFAGLGAPHWDPGARGRIEGLTFATNAAHLARAAVDSIAYQVADLVDAVDLDLGVPVEELRIDGGASRNDALVQFQADLLARPVLRSASPDAAALGAAYLAGLAVGVWSGDDDIEALPRRFDTFEPRPDAPREQLLAGWRAALGRDGVEASRT
jgi:glycerol kinase